MILYVQGDLFQSPAQVLVNTVNTVGVMGKGVALQFKQLFPEMFEQYRILCERKSFDIGNLWLYRGPNKWVLNFPTKRHWKQPSKIEYIAAGLSKFVATYDEMGIHSIAFPPLGCGNGQLDFKSEVQPLMHQFLHRLPIDVFIYPEKNDPFVPEHLDPLAMRNWLRSEP
ncbi:MAG TPA: macro domain-containing protein, partial [Caldilineaceae bacterium]|nr:macro domain-containing protein [Caldilineaceae bacterium]